MSSLGRKGKSYHYWNKWKHLNKHWTIIVLSGGKTLILANIAKHHMTIHEAWKIIIIRSSCPSNHQTAEIHNKDKNFNILRWPIIYNTCRYWRLYNERDKWKLPIILYHLLQFLICKGILCFQFLAFQRKTLLKFFNLFQTEYIIKLSAFKLKTTRNELLMSRLSERNFSNYIPCSYSILHLGSFNTPARLITAKPNDKNR